MKSVKTNGALVFFILGSSGLEDVLNCGEEKCSREFQMGMTQGQPPQIYFSICRPWYTYRCSVHFVRYLFGPAKRVGKEPHIIPQHLFRSPTGVLPGVLIPIHLVTEICMFSRQFVFTRPLIQGIWIEKARGADYFSGPRMRIAKYKNVKWH